MRFFLGAFLLVALAGCNSFSSKPNTRLVVVDHSGAPVAGAVIEPVPEDSKAATLIESQAQFEKDKWTTGPDGMIHNDLEEYYWDSDSCYHFHVHRLGYEDFDITVSKDLMPPIYRIELRDRVPVSR